DLSLRHVELDARRPVALDRLEPRDLHQAARLAGDLDHRGAMEVLQQARPGEEHEDHQEAEDQEHLDEGETTGSADCPRKHRLGTSGPAAENGPTAGCHDTASCP